MSGLIGKISSRNKIINEPLTDGGVLLGSGVDAITATAALADGEILIGDGTTDPVALDVGSSSSITVLGTVATGEWRATDVGVQYGGTGASTHTANGVLLGAGTAAITSAAPSTTGNVLTSNGTVWASAAPAGGGKVVRTAYNATVSNAVTVTSATWASYVNTITLTSPTIGNHIYAWATGGGYVIDASDNYKWSSIMMDDTGGGGIDEAEVSHVFTGYVNAGGGGYSAGCFAVAQYTIPGGFSGNIVIRNCPYVSSDTWSMNGCQLIVMEIEA